MTERTEFLGPGARFLVVMASAVVVVAGLRAAAPILLPFSLALFIAVLSLPILLWLRRRGVPPSIAILMAVLADLAVIVVLVFLVMQSVADFQDRGGIYAARLQNLFRVWIDGLQERGIPAGEYVSTELVSASAIMDLAGSTISRIASFLSNTFLVILILVFILAEASVFPAKFRAALEAGEGDGDVGRFAKIVDEVLGYLAIKTLVSLATGITIGLFAWMMGLDFPVLLGLIGFALNYVPTIGSILAAVPALVLTLIQFGGFAPLAFVALGYLCINTVFGNFLEPHLLGRRLGMSTLVVILSLLFWAWVWGPVGALLAVPLTMVVKIMLENTKDLRWIALLLDKEAPRAGDARPAGLEVSGGLEAPGPG
jgi:AI-2 transport protein TqsA